MYLGGWWPTYVRFRFRRLDGHVLATAANLTDFARILARVDTSVVAHHLEHGDFSRWLLGTIQDRELAASVGAIERSFIARRTGDLLRAQEDVSALAASRYLPQADGAADAGAERADLIRRAERALGRASEVGEETSAALRQVRRASRRHTPSS